MKITDVKATVPKTGSIKETIMDKKRNVTREDVPLWIRLMAEGVRYVVKGTPAWDPPP